MSNQVNKWVHKGLYDQMQTDLKAANDQIKEMRSLIDDLWGNKYAIAMSKKVERNLGKRVEKYLNKME